MPRLNPLFDPTEGGDFRILIISEDGTMRHDDKAGGFRYESHAKKYFTDNPERYSGKQIAIVRFWDILRVELKHEPRVIITSRRQGAKHNNPQKVVEAPESPPEEEDLSKYPELPEGSYRASPAAKRQSTLAEGGVGGSDE